jgi:hypothetical protein
VRQRTNDTINIWDELLLASSREPTTINYARVLAFLDLPIKSRNIVKMEDISYIPITFQIRNPESIKRKLNRWRQKHSKLDLLTEIKSRIEGKAPPSKITIIEVPTNRDPWCAIFVLMNNASFVLWLLNDSELEYRARKYPGFRWDKYDCKVIATGKKKFWESLAEWSHRAMQDPIRNADSGLFEYILLNGLTMADLKETTWRAHHKGYFTPTLTSFLAAFAKFFESIQKKPAKKIK